MENNWCEQLRERWQSQGLASDRTANEAELSAFELTHSVRLPDDVRLYFEQLNGMSLRAGHDVDINGFSFLPLSAIQTVAEFSAAKGWVVEGEMQGETSFIFVDYLQWSCAYAFAANGPMRGSIYLLGFRDPKLVATSMRHFVELYLLDDPALYGA